METGLGGQAAAIYDAHYRRKRDRGLPGWLDAEGDADVFSRLLPRLEAAGSLGPEVLEVGCGAGNLSNQLAGLGFRVTGADISATAIEWARGAYPKLEFIHADLRDKGTLAGRQFDWILDGFCWHFVCERRPEFLAQVFRLLKPGGWFIVSTLCGDPESLPGNDFDPVSRMQRVDGVPVTYFGEEGSLKAELQQAGFEIVRWSTDPAVPGVRASHLLIDARRPAW